MPASYRLWDPAERRAFLDAVEADERERAGAGVAAHRENGMGRSKVAHAFRPWIMKQAHMDNGQGIEIISLPQQLAELKAKLRAIPSSARSARSAAGGAEAKKETPFYRHLIAQRYLLRPLLTADGHKFDLRMYWLVASVSPLVVLYHDGYMRVSMSRYSEKDFQLRTALTNAKVAKQGADGHGKHDYEAFKESTRRPFSELGVLLGGAANLNALRCKIQNALADIVAATKVAIFDHAAASGCVGCFALMGADFMIGHDAP